MSQIRRMAYLLAAIYAVAIVVGMVWNPVKPHKFTGISSNEIPRTVNGYSSSQDLQLGEDVQRQLASSTTVARSYTNGSRSVQFIIIGGTDRTALHDPRSCLIGSGWSLVDDRTERLPETTVDIRTCRAIGAHNDINMDVIYTYVVDGQVVNNPTEIRAAMLRSALLGRKNTPVYFLEFTTPVTNSMNNEDHLRLIQFSTVMWRELAPFLHNIASKH